MKKIYVVWVQYSESYEADFEFAFTSREKAEEYQNYKVKQLQEEGYFPSNLDEELGGDSDCNVWIECVELKED